MKSAGISLLLSMATILLLDGCGIKTMPFYIERYEKNPEKIAPKFIESEGVETLKAYAFHKVFILEFNVEYHVDMKEEVYRRTTDELYNIFVESLISNTGWEVVKRGDLKKSSTFKNLKKEENIKYVRKRKTGKSKKDERSVITPATGLGILPSGKVFGKRSLSRYFQKTSKEAKILEDLGVDAAFKVHTVVDYARRGRRGRARIIPSVKHFAGYSTVAIDIGYTKTPSLTAEKGDAFNYKYNGHCEFLLKDPLNSYGEFDVKKGTFDLDEYIYWLKEMYWVYSEMLGIELARNL